MKPPLWTSRAALVVVGAMLLGVVLDPASPGATTLLDPVAQPKFANTLPIPARIDATDGDHFEMEMNETSQWLGLYGPGGQHLMTTVWGYGLLETGHGHHPNPGVPVSYPGPTFVAREDVPITVTWNNNLPPYNFPHGPGAHLLPVDPTLHMAHPLFGGIPTVTHLHGGHTESASDGLPEAWFTQEFAETGPQFVKREYRYDNTQEAATLWYHDHALGITRLNVYAGLAGFYLLRDRSEERLQKTGVLPEYPYEIEVVVQDRMFTDQGALFYPSEDPDVEPGFDPLPPGPSAIAEFFGDFVLVNGVAWPHLNVDPRKYRFRLLNGSDSRFYVFELRNDRHNGSAQPFMQIGTDDGLLTEALSLSRLVLGPGERADLVVDFSAYPEGTELYLRNFGPDEPFKGFNGDGTLSDGAGGALDPADPQTTGQIMKFVVTGGGEVDERRMGSGRSTADARVEPGTRLRSALRKLHGSAPPRRLALFEGRDSYGRLQPLLGTLDEGSMAWFEPITENPMLDDTEVWEIYNSTEDAHPMHLHLVAFQIIDRESFDGYVDEKPQPQHDGSTGVGGILTVTGLGGDAEGPAPNEAGWKDTAIMPPGKVTRVIARFDRPGRYVWHCHILSHEDHEMMRPFEVRSPAEFASQPVVVAGSEITGMTASGTHMRFVLEQPADVHVKVFNILGQLVQDLGTARFDAGTHRVVWDGMTRSGRLAPSGVYFYWAGTSGAARTARTIVVR